MAADGKPDTSIMSDGDFEIIARDVLFQGFFRIDRYRLRHRLFSGAWSDEIVRELFERGHAAAVLPYDPVRDEVVLIKQFRIGALHAPGGPWLLEIVAGMMESEETAAEVVRREAQEEAGCRIEALVPICEYLVSPGGTSERISLFCGKVDAGGVGGLHGCSAEGEDIRANAVGFEEALAMLAAGRINSASPIIALQWLSLNRDRLRRDWSAKAPVR